MQKLINKYNEIMMRKNIEAEKWAVHKRNDQSSLVKCSIPFIGKKYFEQDVKILVYASAEVLSDYYPGSESERAWLDDDEKAGNRHRYFFDWTEIQEDRFFPNVHIQPMNDGALAVAVGYIASKIMKLDDDILPHDFYEKIAFGNYGKYTRETKHQHNLRMGQTDSEDSKKNIDYSSNSKFLKLSYEFVKADVETLRPDYIIMPKSIYKTERTDIDSIKGDAKIVPIYQMNSGVINRIIHGKKAYKEKDISLIHPAIRKWYDNLYENGIVGGTKKNYCSVFTYIDNEPDIASVLNGACAEDAL